MRPLGQHAKGQAPRCYLDLRDHYSDSDDHRLISMLSKVCRGSRNHVNGQVASTKVRQYQKNTQNPRVGRGRGKCSVWDRMTLLFYRGAPQPPALLRSKRALELLEIQLKILPRLTSSFGFILRRGYSEGTPPWTPVCSKGTFRAGNSRIIRIKGLQT